MGKSFRTLHTIPKPPPSVDGGKESPTGGDMSNHCQLHIMELATLMTPQSTLLADTSNSCGKS